MIVTYSKQILQHLMQIHERVLELYWILLLLLLLLLLYYYYYYYGLLYF